jgi:hypothetical protein
VELVEADCVNFAHWWARDTAFADEEKRLSGLAALQAAEAQIAQERDRRDDLAATFRKAVAALLRELEVWQEATPAENRILIEDLIDAVVIHPDHLQVLVNGAPPLNVTSVS